MAADAHRAARQGSQCRFQQTLSSSPRFQQLAPLVNKLLQQWQTGSTTPARSQSTQGNPPTSNAVSPLTAEQAETLRYNREEEKLARDVYKTLGEQRGIRSFDNIARSEQQHMDTMARQLAMYGLADPVTDDSVGAFSNPELADLYQQLVERGSQSPQEALQVGAFIEELDMRGLQQSIDGAGGQPQLAMAYANLLKGSRNHLRAFVGQIESRGTAYQAQLLPQQEVDGIAASGFERGNVEGSGPRNRRSS